MGDQKVRPRLLKIVCPELLESDESYESSGLVSVQVRSEVEMDDERAALYPD